MLLTAALPLLLAPYQSSVPLYNGLGDLHRKVTTSSPQAQRYFDQGLAFLYAFNHDEAIRSFRQASIIDRECAMAHWGVATANGPHINNPFVDEAKAKMAWDAVQRAKRYAPGGTPTEKALIRALEERFAKVQPADRSGLDRDYATAMADVWRQFPQDPDVGALYAEAMMDLRPWDLWKPNGSPQPGTTEIVRTLERVMAIAPKHPLANHLYIHAVEASPNPAKALKAADTLRDLQPGLGHMVHMPSHIDVRTGRWKAAVIANDKAIKSDAAYAAKQPDQGFYRLYMTHNYHMLAFAAMMRGQSALAIKTMDDGVKMVPTEWAKANAFIADGFMAMPVEVRVRFGRWDEVLAAPKPAPEFPLAIAMWHMARGVSFSATGRPEEARAELAAFLTAKRQVPADRGFGNNMASSLLLVAHYMLAGEILMGENKPTLAIAALKSAVQAEDQLRYDEPPDWIIPTRHALGAALMKEKRYRDAERVYREDLVKLPSNGWSLYGLADALAKQGKPEADAIREKFKQAWVDADTPITSSCMCLPGD